MDNELISEISWSEAGSFGDAGQHVRSDLIVVVESEDEVRPAGAFQGSMRA